MSESKVFIHPSAFVDKPSSIGLGTKIWHFCHISKDAHIGKNCTLGQNVFIGEGVTIGNNVKLQNNVSVFSGVTLKNNVFCGPSVTFTNVKNPRAQFPTRDYAVTIVETGVTIGANCTIVCGTTLGKYCFIGAGSVVTKNIPSFSLAYGNPARIKGQVNKQGKITN